MRHLGLPGQCSSVERTGLAKFGGETLTDITRTHLMFVIGGRLRQNPFLVPPAV